MTIDGIAQQNDRGIVATCPVTGYTFITSQPKFTTIDGQSAVQCTCRFCTETTHNYLLDQVRYAPPVTD